jgi:hypothetical protein
MGAGGNLFKSFPTPEAKSINNWQYDIKHHLLKSI